MWGEQICRSGHVGGGIRVPLAATCCTRACASALGDTVSGAEEAKLTHGTMRTPRASTRRPRTIRGCA